jgi:uncharacterized protein (DUF849 family)
MSTIIALAATGMIPQKNMTAYVPVSPKEIAETVANCFDMGATVAHIHPRDESGQPTWKKEIFKEIIDLIKSKRPSILISVTTSGRNWSDFERRSECLELTGDSKPDLASLTVGSMNFIKTASVNSPEMIEKLALKMQDNGIKPELEVFEAGMMAKANHLISKGVIPSENPYFNILLGSLGTAPLHPSVFASFHALLPTNAIWSVAGIGNYQLDSNIMSLAYGGHVRVGLEDNIYFDRSKTKVCRNEDLIERLVKIMDLMGLKPATAQETAAKLGLRKFLNGNPNVSSGL